MKPDQLTSWAVGRTFLHVLKDARFNYRVGHILTRYGIVTLFDQQDRREPLTMLELVVNGRTIRATWRRTFSDRYLKTLAVRFARELASEAGHGGAYLTSTLAQGGRGNGR